MAEAMRVTSGLTSGATSLLTVQDTGAVAASGAITAGGAITATGAVGGATVAIGSAGDYLWIDGTALKIRSAGGGDVVIVADITAND